MNSNSLIGYMGLINKNYSSSIDADDIICDSITAQHYYNIGCETLNTSFVNPELTLSFDPTNNMFTLHLYDSSIPLSRLVVGMYDSLAVPETLVFRDATNSTTLNTLIVSGLLTATANTNSVVSNANLINLTNSTTNQYNPIVFITSSLVDGYKDLHYDNLNHLSINPVTNTLRITGGNLQLNNSSLSISDATGAITYGLLYSGGINLYGTAKYMIGGIQLKTNDIPESVGGNLYYTDARSRLSISVSSIGSEILGSYNNSSGVITIPAITNASISLSKLNTSYGNYIIVCNASTGVPTYVPMTGDVITVNGATGITANAVTNIKVLDNTLSPVKILKGTVGQFLQTSSSLVNNWVTMTGDATLSGLGYITLSTNAIINAMVTAYYNIGVASLSVSSIFASTATYISGISTSLILGCSGLNDGVLSIQSQHAPFSTHTYSTIIQNSSANTYIDNSLNYGGVSTLGSSINIGTILNGQTVNLGSFGGTIKFGGGAFNNVNKVAFLVCGMTTSVPISVWTPILNVGAYLACGITTRSANSTIKITVNISLMNWGTASSNHHISLVKNTSNSWPSPIYYDIPSPSVGTNYGLQHYLAGTQYGSANFTYIDTTNTTVGTYFYCVVVRSNSAATVSSNIGNNSYADISVEELF